MGKLNSFTFITLDGYYKTLDGDISWHKHGGEEGSYSAESLQSGNMLLFGRTTYEMMASFWPTPMAMDLFPVVAEGMNKAEKLVFSRTLENAAWENTRIVNGDILAEVKALKQKVSNDMTLLGSGSIVSQFAAAGLIDAYQIMIDPIAIGDGASLFKNISRQLHLRLVSSRIFNSGVVLLNYEPA
jgi:dihydrofolate reductase